MIVPFCPTVPIVPHRGTVGQSGTVGQMGQLKIKDYVSDESRL